MNILEIKINKFKYENNEEIVLKDLNLNIKSGELIAITGLSGCGKTTLTRILNGLIPNHYGGILDGEVCILGKNILDYKKGELAKYIGNVFQIEMCNTVLMIDNKTYKKIPIKGNEKGAYKNICKLMHF